MKYTALICTIAMIILAIYDGIAVSIGGVPSSISRWLSDTGFAAPGFVFAFGFVCGHVFGYMRPSMRVALAPIIENLPEGYVVTMYARKGSLNSFLDSKGLIIASQTLETSDIDALVRLALADQNK